MVPLDSHEVPRPRSTQVPAASFSVSVGAITRCGGAFQLTSSLPTPESMPAQFPNGLKPLGFGLPFLSPLLFRVSFDFSSSGYFWMFHFPGLASLGLYIQLRMMGHDSHQGFPIQKSSDRRMFSSSPMLIAAYRVFHRLSAPRHSPVALDILINFSDKPFILFLSHFNIHIKCIAYAGVSDRFYSNSKCPGYLQYLYQQ